MRLSTLLTTVLLLSGTLAAPREAESSELDFLRQGVKEIVEDVTLRCRFDLETYCGNVTPGDGRLAFCLMAHADKRSPQCEYALFDASRAANRLVENVDASIEACQTDIATLCAGLVTGQGRIAKCLADQKPDLSPQCSDVIDVVGKVIFPTHNQHTAAAATAPSAVVAAAEGSPASTPEPAPIAPILTVLASKVQGIIERSSDGCRSDLEAYCSDVTPGEGRLAYCLIDNADRRSTSCENALAEARLEADELIAFVNVTIDSCEPDMAALCSDTEIGEGRIARCLVDQRPSLSQRCGKVIDIVGQAVYPPRDQPVLESATTPAASAEITTGSIEDVPAETHADSAKTICRTLESSVTDWDKEATARDARKLLSASVEKHAGRRGITDYKSGGTKVTCSTNVDLFIAGNYTCRAQARVCWSAVEPVGGSPRSAAKTEQ